MKKKHFIGLSLIAIFACSSLLNLQFISPNKSETKFTLASVETASAFDVGEWWDRKDYNCISVTCKPLFLPSYKSNFAEKVEDGKGSVAHTWSCTGCGDAGFTVD